MTFEFVEAARLLQGMTMPQIGILVFLFAGMFTHIVRHGEARPKENVATVGFCLLTEAALLYWGDFFQVSGWPQGIWCFLTIMTLGVTILMRGKIIGKYNAISAIATIVFVYVPILIYSGFFS